jgi:radical SAM superfamily enzyme
VERLNPSIAVERFVSQSPKSLLIAPDWGLKSQEFAERIARRFAERDTWQGRLFDLKNLH